MHAFFRSSVFMFLAGQLVLLVLATVILLSVSRSATQTTTTVAWQESVRVRFEKDEREQAETKEQVGVLKTKVEKLNKQETDGKVKSK